MSPTFALVIVAFVGSDPWPVAGRVLLSGVSESHCQEVLEALKAKGPEQHTLVAACASEEPLEAFTFDDGETYP